MATTGLVGVAVAVAMAGHPAAPPRHQWPLIVVAGDSIAQGIGRELCSIVRLSHLEYRCRVNAKIGLASWGAIRRVDRKADILVLSAGTNDKDRAELVANLGRIRARAKPGAAVWWVGPHYPAFAPAAVLAEAQSRGDKVETPDYPARGSLMRRIHPLDYEQAAFDLMLAIISLPSVRSEGQPVRIHAVSVKAGGFIGAFSSVMMHPEPKP